MFQKRDIMFIMIVLAILGIATMLAAVSMWMGVIDSTCHKHNLTLWGEKQHLTTLNRIVLRTILKNKDFLDLSGPTWKNANKRFFHIERFVERNVPATSDTYYPKAEDGKAFVWRLPILGWTVWLDIFKSNVVGVGFTVKDMFANTSNEYDTNNEYRLWNSIFFIEDRFYKYGGKNKKLIESKIKECLNEQ